MATWSLREAACYVHNVDPDDREKDILPRSTFPPAQTYYWLKKEFEKHRLHKVEDDADGPRFSPGTLMRHLNDKGKRFNKCVFSAYNNHGDSTGPSDKNTKTFYAYRRASKRIHDLYPHLRKSQVALLLTDLPVHFEKWSLPRRRPITIQKYFDPRWKDSSGRPKKTESDLPQIDWPELVKNLTK